MRTIRTLAGIAVLTACMTGTATAQESSMQFKLGGFFPSGGDDFWAETEDTFTLDTDDFQDAILGFTYVHGVTNNVEIGFNVDIYDATVVSAYRGVVDEDGFSILHDSTLQMVPMSVDVRLLPGGRYAVRGPRGRLVQRPVFYLGGGIGVNFFEYEEIGDFVDFGDPALPVGFDRFRDQGAAFQTHVLAGVELPLGERWSLMFEGKHTWVDEELGDDFAGLGTIDLGGFSISAGASIRF